MYAGVAFIGRWAPNLGLDLQGGTRITLQASTATGQAITPEKLQQAADIINARVNASGVAEAVVTTQGSNNIIVEIPGQSRQDLVDTVKQTAQLRFRLVAASAYGGPATPTPTGTATPGATPTDTATPGATPTGTATPSASTSVSPSASATPAGRAMTGSLRKLGKNTTSAQSTATPTPTPTDTATPTATGTASPTDPVQAALAWQKDPSQPYPTPSSTTNWMQKFNNYVCPTAGGTTGPVQDQPDQPLITCDNNGNKFLLSNALIEGTDLTNASAGIPANQVSWVVNLTMNSAASGTFATVTQAIVNTGLQFAIVLDGTVISAPTVNGVILNGQAEISGAFTQAEAQSLANSLKYGALPLRFDAPSITEEGPTLAADQLTAGLTAGAIGLALVMIYAMFYYRGLGLVVLSSLVVAAAVTYAAVLLLSKSAGFTLTLPGIAGLIVAIGITADSFIVYFERIRDELRDGKSLRVAVEAAWIRARNTCVAADSVSILAAVVLYIFAIGVVKGFAFALGVSTLIDLVVFFHFTKPVVTLLARVRFFSAGHRMSGLSADHIGIEPAPATTAGVAR
jgi:preprotein translocase subunit SecD